jgi:Na+-transporting NADH:ubiquinone oxidoreductase subunit C
MANKDSFGRTIIFIVSVCLVCSIVVAGSAVGLRPMQVANKLLDKQTKILEAAGLLERAGKDIKGTYTKYVEAKMVDLATGQFVDGNPDTFDERLVSRKLDLSVKPEQDLAGISRMAKHQVIYLVKDDAGKTSTVILPIVGSGLWDLMFGYVGLETDLNTIKSVVYSDHKETPGLGGEVVNPKWKALWPNKKLYNADNEVAISIVKGGAEQGDIHGVDGLSGATLTSKGIDNTFKFWFGNEGYGSFIANYRNGGLN